ncbi:dnaJ homolog subfamily C member 7 isoform X1 [Eurytemora carolleeae]|uniref:dnaJ homolog subfamily C member 7 isoform X1 n=1 Tax=Eurytemora carolleeae TaxID=1294199 RepID=UPI000C793BA9|nr:dnaJ homolog subfamily C member 7 isoform X1 [Eurytemora carolleeae]|eukprot:XP_023327875.1 dnaJ homolog subfamily C member 7-like isoform X1 [Eurytemora affinis]
MKKGGTEKFDRGRTELRSSGSRGRFRSEDPGANHSFVESTLSEIRSRHGSTEKISSHEIDELLGHIRRSRSSSVDYGLGSGKGVVLRPPPPQFTPPPLPKDTFLPDSTPFGPSLRRTRWENKETMEKEDLKQPLNQASHQTVSQFFEARYDGSISDGSPSTPDNTDKSSLIQLDLKEQKRTTDQNIPSLTRAIRTKKGVERRYKDMREPRLKPTEDCGHELNDNEELSMIGRSDTRNMSSASMTKYESNLGLGEDSCKREPSQTCFTFPAKSDHDKECERTSPLNAHSGRKVPESKFHGFLKDASTESGDSDKLVGATDLVKDLRLADERKEEGNQLYKLKNYRDALQKYSEAIDLCPQCAAFYTNRSACYLMLGQPKQALEDAKTATSIEPDFNKGWSRVAKCSLMLGDSVTARQALQRAGQDGDPEMRNIEILEKLKTDTNNAYNTKDFRKALYYIDKSLEIATHCYSLKTSRAECLAFLGRYAEAQEAANYVLQFDNINVDAIYVRGLCLYYEDNVDRAFSHFTQVLRLAPDHLKAKEIYKKAKALKQKKEEGNTAFKAGQLDEAYSLYSDALSIDPLNKTTNSKIYFNRATVSAKLKKLEDSIEDCSRAIDLDPSYTKAYLRRAKSYMDTEQYEDAVRDYESVFKTDRSNREYRQLLQDAKLELRKSKRKDYYKILGVGKAANDEEVKKAYRKRAMVHHPDRHSGATEQEKKDHEHKFKEVGEAYAVLSDEKKRRMYDSGQDLDDAGGHGYQDIDPNSIFQAFFNGGMGGHGGMGAQHFNFGGPGGGGGGHQNFSFQFG